MDRDTWRSAGSVSDPDCWLRCEGFCVESPDGRIGFVAELRFSSRIDRPDELVVHAGLLGRRILIVPVSEVTEIRPGQRRIVLGRSPSPSASGLAGESRLTRAAQAARLRVRAVRRTA